MPYSKRVLELTNSFDSKYKHWLIYGIFSSSSIWIFKSLTLSDNLTSYEVIYPDGFLIKIIAFLINNLRVDLQ